MRNTGRFAAIAGVAVLSAMSMVNAPLWADEAQPPAEASPAAAPAESAPADSTQADSKTADPTALPTRHEAQPYVGRFLIYTGFMFLDSPVINLFEPGIHVQAGMRWSRHISLGFDYSRGTGNATVGLGLATTALQKELAPVIASAKALGLTPPNSLPLGSTTQTITAGPEFPWRRWKRFTPYIRPSCGFILEHAVAEPHDNLTKIAVHLIDPSGYKDDTALFYGVGGGVGINFTKHFSIVVQADFVHDHLFPDLLQNGRNTVRFSIGPGIQFGSNVTRHFILN